MFKVRTISDVADDHARALESEVGPGVPYRVPDPGQCCSLVLASEAEVELIYRYYREALPRDRYERLVSMVRHWYQSFCRTKSTALRRPLEDAQDAYHHPCPFFHMGRGECVLGSLRPLACHPPRKASVVAEGWGHLGRRGYFVAMLAEKMHVRVDVHPTLLGLGERRVDVEERPQVKKYFTQRARMYRGRIPPGVEDRVAEDDSEEVKQG